MAAGDITFDTAPVHSVGDLFMATGQIEVDNTAREFAILPKSYIFAASLLDADGVNYARCALNSSDGTIGTQAGSLYVDGNAAGPNTFTFAVYYK